MEDRFEVLLSRASVTGKSIVARGLAIGVDSRLDNDRYQDIQWTNVNNVIREAFLQAEANK